MKSPTSTKLYSPDGHRPKSQVKIVVTPTSEAEDLFMEIGTDKGKGEQPRRSTVNRGQSSSSLQNNIVIPEEAVRPKK